MTDPVVAGLEVPVANLKTLRETLCRVQGHYNRYADPQGSGPGTESRYLGALIAAIDLHRPLGSNGKHGNLHTPTCGCEDK